MAPIRTARTPLPTCVVFAAGEYYPEPIDVPPGTFVVAADGLCDQARARRGLLTAVFAAAAPRPTLVGAPAAAVTLGAPSTDVSAALAYRG